MIVSKPLATKRAGYSLLLAAALSLSALQASASSLGLEVLINGTQAGAYTSEQLGCGSADITTCVGAGALVGGSSGLSLDSWNLYVDSDPVISGIVAVTNMSAVTQQFTLIFTLPIAPAIPGGTVIGGSIQGGATDNNGNGVTLSAPTGAAFYAARIDGADVQTLYNAPQSFSAGNFLSVNVPTLSFGTPIPSQIGPAALSNIGIRLDFLLTAGDSASFTSNFVVQPIPVPAAGLLFGGALGLLGWARRRA
ncbi:MAG: hypothetical protein ABIX37_08525 [Gammaproteobacteria bacterium]